MCNILPYLNLYFSKLAKLIHVLRLKCGFNVSLWTNSCIPIWYTRCETIDPEAIHTRPISKDIHYNMPYTGIQYLNWNSMLSLLNVTWFCNEQWTAAMCFPIWRLQTVKTIRWHRKLMWFDPCQTTLREVTWGCGIANPVAVMRSAVRKSIRCQSFFEFSKQTAHGCIITWCKVTLITT